MEQQELNINTGQTRSVTHNKSIEEWTRKNLLKKNPPPTPIESKEEAQKDFTASTKSKEFVPRSYGKKGKYVHIDDQVIKAKPVDFTPKSGFSSNLNDLGLNHKQIRFVKAFVQNPKDPASAYLSVYEGVKRGAASSAASRLLQKPAIREAVTRQIFFMRQIEKIDKVFVVKTLKEMIARCSADDDRKYLIEGLDMLNRLAGFYNENKNPTLQINTSNVSFGGWNPNEPVKSNDNPQIEQGKEYNEFEDILPPQSTDFIDEQDFTDAPDDVTDDEDESI